jgi:hypothetical protein
MAHEADNGADLQAELEALLEQARIAIKSWLLAKALPLAVPIEQLVIEPNEQGNGWRSDRIRCRLVRTRRQVQQ